MKRALIGLATLAVVGPAGCGKMEPPAPLPLSSRPAAAPSHSFRPVPAPSHRWRVAGLACPRLGGPAAEVLGVAGPGRQAGSLGTDRIGRSVDCVWHGSGGAAITVTLHLEVARSQQAADAQWQVETSSREEPLPGAGEAAYVADLPDPAGALLVQVRSGNAYGRLEIVPKAPDGAAVLRGQAAGLAGDVLDDLAPA